MKSIYKKLLTAICVLTFLQHNATAQTDENSYDSYKPLLIKNAIRLGISAADVGNAVVTNAYTDSSTQITYIYLQQAYKQIKVYNTIISIAFRNGSFLYASGNFVKEIAAVAGSAVPAQSFMQATKAATNHLQLKSVVPLLAKTNLFITQKKYQVAAIGIAKKDIDVTLFWMPSDNKTQVTLTWNVNIDVLGSSDWWNVLIDANTGAFIKKSNWTVYEKRSLPIPVLTNALAVLPNKFVSINPKIKNSSETTISPILNAPPPSVTSASYNVIPFPIENLNFGSIATVTNPWLMAGAGNNAITYGWHYDGTTNYNITRGNNVFASLDVENTNTPDAINNWPDTSTTASPTLTFTRTPDFTQQPGNSTNNVNKKFALDNLFYWNNLMHDVFYQYGFNEVAGNFQADNLSRGGIGGDYVAADAQDGSNINHTEFSTPPDGSSGRMQMCLSTAPPITTINSPSTIAGNVLAAEGAFKTTVSNRLADTGPKTGNVILFNDATGNHVGCGIATNAAAILGNIALIDYQGSAGCFTYSSKVLNAQNSGAIACILYSSNNGVFIPVDADADAAAITIPFIVITNATGLAIVNQLTLGNSVNLTMIAGIGLDPDLNNGTICHEYGHGISTRLTGGPTNGTCLNNAEQGGEGWSDYFALMMTADWNTAALTDGLMARSTGGRRHPYSTNLAIDPITYADMATDTESHATGEILCSALWDMTWNIIQQQGSITKNLYNNTSFGGNAIALNLVITGLKLQPCNPGFLDARDAILAADSLLYNFAHKCAIWSAFARRGMGASAIQGSSQSETDQTAATDLPFGVKSMKPLLLAFAANSQTTVNHIVTCDCQAVTGYLIRDTIPTGFTYVSSNPIGTLNGNVLSFPATNFAINEIKNFSVVLLAPNSGCAIDTVINDNRDGNMVGGFTSSGTSNSWIASTVKAHSGTSSWYASDPFIPSQATLTSAITSAAASKNLSILSFYHDFNTETTFDGGVIEYSTNGVTWTDAGPFFFNSGKYNTAMDPSTELSGRNAFSGNSAGFHLVTLDVSSFGTTPVAFRFKMTSDEGTGSDGWFIDDILRTNGCGAMLKTGYYNSANVLQDAAITPIFITPSIPLPLTLLWFYANQVGGQVQLNWKTVAEINVKDFAVEWSTNGVDWTNIGRLVALNGNTNNYDFTHVNPVNGNNFYRIKMNDADGHFTYSPIRTIKMLEKGNPMLVLVPNPVSNDALLYVSKDLNASTVKIYNALGGLVRQTNIGTGAQQLQISTTGLAAGIYTIGTNGTSQEVIKMVVVH